MINLRDGNQRARRTLLIGDESQVSIGVTLWSEACDAHDFEIGQIIAFKSCRVSDYSGKSLNASWDPRDIKRDLRHPRATELTRWQKNQTPSKMRRSMRALTGEVNAGRDNFMLIAELQQFCEHNQDVLEGKPFYCNIYADLTWVFVQDSPERRPMFYLACPDCRKKVIDDGRGYQCENCNKCHEEAKPTYNFGFKVQDCSG